jgi:hypothetical protein
MCTRWSTTTYRAKEICTYTCPLLATQPAVVVAILRLYLWTFRLPDATYPPKNAKNRLIRAAAYTIVASTTWYIIAQTNPKASGCPLYGAVGEIATQSKTPVNPTSTSLW